MEVFSLRRQLQEVEAVNLRRQLQDVQDLLSLRRQLQDVQEVREVSLRRQLQEIISLRRQLQTPAALGDVALQPHPSSLWRQLQTLGLQVGWPMWPIWTRHSGGPLPSGGRPGEPRDGVAGFKNPG